MPVRGGGEIVELDPFAGAKNSAQMIDPAEGGDIGDAVIVIHDPVTTLETLVPPVKQVL